jgi:putative membrane protein
MSTQEPLKPARPAGPSDHLANERTFLAWIRTSIAVMGFGFVVVKFSLFVRQLALVVDKNVRLPGRGYSPVIGILLIAIGAVMSLLAFFRYRKIERQLSGGSFFPSFRLSLLTTIGLLVISVLLIIYLLLSA